VKEYWIVDPIEKSIEVYENLNGQFKLIDMAEQKGTIKSRLLKGFSVKVEEIF